jgi:hypothetical protein
LDEARSSANHSGRWRTRRNTGTRSSRPDGNTLIVYLAAAGRQGTCTGLAQQRPHVPMAPPTLSGSA